MHTLSDNAVKKQKADMLALAEEVDPAGYLAIIIVGGYLLLKQMTKKMSRQQRAALGFLTICAGGTLIGILVYLQQTWLALVVMFALGYVLATIMRL